MANSKEASARLKINKLESTLKAYIHEATEIEKKWLKVVFKDPREVTIPAELEQVFRKNAWFKKVFYALTPGRQRAYLLHFSDAKQSVTRIARIEKYTQHILDGKWMQDR